MPFRALWRAVIRFEPEKIVVEVAVRNTIGFTIAVIVGTVLASPSTGVVAGLGALNVAYADGRDPYVLRARRMLISALLSGIAIGLGAISGRSNVAAVAVAGLWAFASGMLVALGTTAADLGVVTLVTLVVFAAKPLPPVDAMETAAVAVSGGLLQALLSTFLWPIRRYEPERRVIGEIFSGLATVARAQPRVSSAVGNAPPMTKQISDAQEAFAPLARDHGIEAERHLFLLVQAERIRLSILNLGRLRRRIARHEGGEAATATVEQILEHAASALQQIGEWAVSPKAPGTLLSARGPHVLRHQGFWQQSPVPSCGQVARCIQTEQEQLAADLAELRAQPTPAGNTFFGALLRDARHQSDALRSQIGAASGAASGTRTDSYQTGSESLMPEAIGSEPWRLRFEGWRARLAANLSFDSTVFRHAVRLAVCLAAGDAVGRSLSLQRTYWIPMTIAIVLKPDFTGTFSRGVLRIGGTLAGLVLATLMFHFVHTGVATDIALMAFFFLLLRLVGPTNYGIFVVAVSALVVLLIAVTGVAPRDVIAPRALNTAIGGALALFAYAVWPTWERTQTSAALADMLDAYRNYLRAVTAAYEGAPVVAIERVRVKGRRARSNAEASVDRMSGEPGVTSKQVAALDAILVHSHSFVHAAMAMEAGLYRKRRDASPEWLPDFAASADRALDAMAALLRSPNGRVRRSRLGEVGAHRPIANGNPLLEIESDRIRTALRSLGEEIAKRGWL